MGTDLLGWGIKETGMIFFKKSSLLVPSLRVWLKTEEKKGKK
jgi:hypothetical protein